MTELTWDELGSTAGHVDPYGQKTAAVAFAVRAGHTDATAARFLGYLCMQGLLGQTRQYGPALRHVMDLEAEAKG